MLNKYLIFLFVCLLNFANILFCNNIKHTKGIKFIENKNQWDSKILFSASLQNSTAYLEKNSILMVYKDSENNSHNHDIKQKCSEQNKSHAIRIKLINSNPNSSATALFKSFDYNNYYLGNDKSKWVSKAYSYSEIIYNEVYQGVNWRIYSNEYDIKHDFIIKAFSGSLSKIRLEYEGASKLYLRNGNLVIGTSVGEVIELKPFAYQIINNEEKAVDVEFVLNGNIISYKVGKYDTGYDLIIDPTLIFSTYSGSVSDNWGFTTTFDKKGNVYAGGIVSGSLYPITSGAFQTDFAAGAWDIVVTKFDPSGKRIIYSTFLGSSGNEMPHSMIVNEYDELIIYGTTGGNNFPITEKAYQKEFKGGNNVIYDGTISFPNGCDIFISKLNSDGTSLLGSTFIGGTKNDGLNYSGYNSSDIVTYFGNDSLFANYGDGARGELITDDRNNVYVGSCTFSSDFPIKNAFQTKHGGKQDGVVFKLDYSLSNLLFSSYLGGSEDDAIYSIDTDNKYKLYVTGGTVSLDFPTTEGAYSTKHNSGITDAFLSLISYDGSSLISSTYFGSDKYDQSYFVRTDKYDFPHIFGQTKASGTTLVHNANYFHQNSGQFTAKFSPDLKKLEWSTVWGTSDGEINISPTAFAVDICGRTYAVGWGRVFKNMSGFVGRPIWGTTNMQTTSNAYMRRTDGQDIYMMCLEANASALNYASFFGEYNTNPNIGNDHVDGGTSRFDRFATLYQTVCASCGGSYGFPTYPNDVHSDSNYSQNCNAATFKFNVNNDFPIADFDLISKGCLPDAIELKNNSRGDLFFWDFGDGSTSSLSTPTHTYTKAGIYEVMLIAKNNNGCSLADTAYKTLVIQSNTSSNLPDIITCPKLPTQIGIDYYPQQNVKMKWYPSSLLNNDNISNPIATLDNTTDFMLIIDNGTCKDTLKQRVIVEYIKLNQAKTINTCNSPYELILSTIESDSYCYISKERDFSTLLNKDKNTYSASIELEQSSFVYIKVEKDGCFGIDSIWFEFNGTRVDLETKDVRCFGENNAEAKALVSLGQEPYSYYWSNGKTESSISNLSQGEYNVVVSDSKGCSSKKIFWITEPSVLEYEVEKKDNNCKGACSGYINIKPKGGNEPYVIKWEDNIEDFSRSELCSKDYIFTITDSKSCKISDNIPIVDTSTLKTKIIKVNNHCQNVCIGSAEVVVEGGSEPFTYSWSNAKDTKKIDKLCNGIYYIEIKDKEGCSIKDSAKITGYNIFEGFWVSASNTNIKEGEKITLSSLSLSDMHYQWIPSNVDAPNNHITTATPLSTTTYQLIVSDQNGCYHKDSVRVFVEVVLCDKPNIFVPNIFTPNNDGKNDILKVSGDWIQSMNFSIFNRWGENVFNSKDIEHGWDGKYKGRDCEAGVYFYRLEIECDKGKKYSTSGDITLIR